MKYLLLLVIFFSKSLYAGAPPVDDKPIPPPPYTINNVNQLSIGVEWEYASLENFLDKSFQYSTVLTGGITILNSKNKDNFSPFSGAYAWIDGKDEEGGKHIIFSTYGPNKLINKIMNRVYNINTTLGSNKVTLINNNASARTSIRKKNVLSLSAKMTDECESTKGNMKILNNAKTNNSVNNYLSWSSKKVCKAEVGNINLSGQLKDIKVKNILWAKTYENMTIIYTNPLKLAINNVK